MTVCHRCRCVFGLIMWSMAAAANKLGQIRRKVQGQSLVIISSFSYRPPRSVLRRHRRRIGRVHFQAGRRGREPSMACGGSWRDGWFGLPLNTTCKVIIVGMGRSKVCVLNHRYRRLVCRTQATLCPPPSPPPAPQTNAMYVARVCCACLCGGANRSPETCSRGGDATITESAPYVQKASVCVCVCVGWRQSSSVWRA